MRTLVLAAALLAGPALAFDPTGEVIFHPLGGIATGAAYDAERVVGPTVNIAKAEGGWSGDIEGQDLQLDVSPTRIQGVNLSLSISQKDGRTEIEGLAFGRRVRLQLTKSKLTGRFGACSFDLARKSPALLQGNMGCMRAGASVPLAGTATLRLSGDAAAPNPPLPQFPLALLASLSG